MSKSRPKASIDTLDATTETARASAQRRPPSAGVRLPLRIAVSVLVVWHLVAVFMAPLSLPPASEAVVALVQGTPDRPSPMQWYLDALYLNHGYHFFAPSPGPGHLIRYRVLNDRGDTVAEGEFPDRKEFWPRLRYHRHFMLADQAELPLPNRQPDAAQRSVLEAYARHMLRIHGGAEARVSRIAHYMLSPQEARQRRRANRSRNQESDPLDAPYKYETMMEVVQRSDDLAGNGELATSGSARQSAWQSGGTPRSVR